MKIIINGREKKIETPANLKAFIEGFCRNPAHVIAELNGSVVKNQEWDKRGLQEGDRLDLVNFVGGG